jgi:DNA-binding transcriptional LysR family regulator
MVAAGRLAPLSFDVGTRQFSLVTHKERLRSRAAQAFVDEL